MSDILKPGRGILFMKVGTHAQETLSDIIARKTKEIEDAGYAMWGYGGSTCHPQTMVQPFAKTYAKDGHIYLCMEEMESKHFAEPIRADEYSVDGSNWKAIPESINVRGSRYALVVKELRSEPFVLPLSRTKVAIGNSTGRPGHRYIQGRVDKACLEVTAEDVEESESSIRIGLVAEIITPYAVYLRNKT